MMGIPSEIITMLGSTILGGILSLWGQKQKLMAQQNQYILAVSQIVSKAQADARQFKDRGFQWTRRIIAISVVMSVIVLPKIVVLFWPDTHVIFGWTALHPGLLFMPDKSALEWQSMQGLVITPLDTQMVSAIIGLYFGGSIVSHHR